MHARMHAHCLTLCPMHAGKRWCFTLNNPDPSDIDAIENWTGCTYLVFGCEHFHRDLDNPDTTPHVQGFVVFRGNMRLAACRRMPSGDRMHWELTRGTNEQAADYCKKEEGAYVHERGVMPGKPAQLEKQRWENARENAKKGAFDDIDADIFIRCYRTVKEIHRDYRSAVEDLTAVSGAWIYGPPGVGKSRKARLDYTDAYFKMQNKWWDGYQGQKHVIMDDVDEGAKGLGHLIKIWSDRYAFNAEIKGGSILIRPEVICVTSNYRIEQLWEDQNMVDAIKRRFRVVSMSGDHPFI